MALIDATVTELLAAFSSSDPTPGGGSAAAVIGAIGASLLAMVAGLPKTKTGAPEERAALDDARLRLVEMRDALAALVDRDAAAYNLVVAAYKLPKATDAEKAERSSAIQHAMRVATETPVETMRACAEALKAARAVAAYGNPSAQSDIAVGVQALTAGMGGALLNVEVNIGSVKDAAIVADITERITALTREMRDVGTTIYSTSGIIDLMKAAAKQSGSLHGPPDRHV